MRFGTGGVPLQSPERDSEVGVRVIRQLGLDALELEFVHGCRMSLEKARAVGAAAKANDVRLSCHASYYLNLLSPEKANLEKTRQELLHTGEVLHAAGGGRLVFHPGFYLELGKAEAYQKMRAALQRLADEFKANQWTAILAPEVTGKLSAFGDLKELYSLAADIGYDSVRPTIDWSHVHARSNGSLKIKADYGKALDLVEASVGTKGLRTLHCHMQGVKFSEKGELHHLPLQADSPPANALIEALIDYDCDGTLISESPILEADALKLQRAYQRAAARK